MREGGREASLAHVPPQPPPLPNGFSFRVNERLFGIRRRRRGGARTDFGRIVITGDAELQGVSRLDLEDDGLLQRTYLISKREETRCKRMTRDGRGWME